MATQVDNAHWRDSAREVKFFILDGTAAFPMLLFLVYMRLSTFLIAISVTLFFSILRHFGFSTIVFLRLLRSSIAGKRKMSVPWWDH